MNTIQAAIAFPLLFLLIIFLLQLGPVLYVEADRASEFHLKSIEDGLDNHDLYTYRENQIVSNVSRSWISTSPEKMHFLIRSVKDSITLLKNEEVTNET